MEQKNEGLEFYRCTLCHKAISIWDLKEKHGCPYCAGARFSPSNLTLWEMIVQIWKHPKVWRWKDVRF